LDKQKRETDITATRAIYNFFLLIGRRIHDVAFLPDK
jgi:hypothetical protein